MLGVRFDPRPNTVPAAVAGATEPRDCEIILDPELGVYKCFLEMKELGASSRRPGEIDHEGFRPCALVDDPHHRAQDRRAQIPRNLKRLVRGAPRSIEENGIRADVALNDREQGGGPRRFLTAGRGLLDQVPEVICPPQNK